MKKTTKSKMFIGAAIFLALLLTGCSSPAGGGNSGGNQDFTDYSVSEIDANSLYYIHKDSHSDSDGNVFQDPNWEIEKEGLFAEIIDVDPIFSKYPQYGDALVDTHGKVLKLATHTTTTTFEDTDNVNGGNSAIIIQDIIVSEESVLSFDYKCDLFYGYDKNNNLHLNYLKVFIDNNATPSFVTYGSGQMWQNASVIISQGTHTVEFIVQTDGWYNTVITNAAYIDNITITSNTIDSVEIYPKGLQETYVNGDKIQFKAKALRSDGSIINGKDIIWSTTGGNIDDNGLFTPGSTSGTFTVTATIDGKTASNETVKVHGSNYLTDPVTINGHTFTGTITKINNTARSDTNKIKFADPTPRYSNFKTDGFFILKGFATDTNPNVFIRKCGEGALTADNKYNPDYPYQTNIILPKGEFEQRIWLRWGNGEYDVWIEECNVTFYENYDGYEGATKTWNIPRGYGESTYFNVTNESDFDYSSEDCAYLLPSDNCQCDDFLITNAFNSVMAELPENATLGQKLRALYDWEAKRSHYDYVSFTDTSTTKRKRQDAVHVIKYGMCVCEGYADLYTAFARLLGVKSAFQWSEYWCHDWTELYYNGEWKMVDLTWDDGSAKMTTDKYPTRENYWYFLIDPNDASHAKKDNEGNVITPLQFDRVTDFSRSAN